MPNIVQINNLSGASPFDIYVCDSTITYCYSAGTTTTSPYTFNVPPPLDSTSPIILKIIDANNCEKIYLLTCQEIYGKQFEDFHIFLFQDSPIYIFEGPV